MRREQLEQFVTVGPNCLRTLNIIVYFNPCFQLSLAFSVGLRSSTHPLPLPRSPSSPSLVGHRRPRVIFIASPFFTYIVHLSPSDSPSYLPLTTLSSSILHPIGVSLSFLCATSTVMISSQPDVQTAILLVSITSSAPHIDLLYIITARITSTSRCLVSILYAYIPG